MQTIFWYLKPVNAYTRLATALHPLAPFILISRPKSSFSMHIQLPWDPLRFITGNYIDAMALVRLEAWRVWVVIIILRGWGDFDFWCRFVECGLEAQQVPKFLVATNTIKIYENTVTDRRKHELLQLLEKRHPWLKLITPNPCNKFLRTVK